MGGGYSSRLSVLILVLLENALRVWNIEFDDVAEEISLNPCFVGKCSTRYIVLMLI